MAKANIEVWTRIDGKWKRHLFDEDGEQLMAFIRECVEAHIYFQVLFD